MDMNGNWTGGGADSPAETGLGAVVEGYSIEVLPRTAAKIDKFEDLLPAGTRVYIANVEGTAFEDMLATAKRIHAAGFPVMPHFPARLIPDLTTLETWLKRYRDETGVDEALVIGGGGAKPVGEIDNSMQILESGLFDRYGFKRLHVAGHPEGNRDIDRDGTTTIVDDALGWKHAFAERTDAEMAIATQFLFDAKTATDWAETLADKGIDLPIHLGIAGPAKLQTLIKFALACGVGPSLQVLKKRAKDVTKLLKPYTPRDVLSDLAQYKAEHPQSTIEQIHFFPLGGIKTCVDWASEQMVGAGQAPLSRQA